MQFITKRIIILNIFILLSIAITQSQQPEYTYLPIKIVLDQNYYTSPFYLYIKYTPINETISSYADSENPRKKFANRIWNLIWEKDVEGLYKISRFKNDRIRNNLTSSIRMYADKITEDDKIIEMYEFGSHTVFVWKLVEKDKIEYQGKHYDRVTYLPIILYQENGDVIYYDRDAEIQPIFQLLYNVYRMPKNNLHSIDNPSFILPKYKIQLPIHYDNSEQYKGKNVFPENNPFYLAFDAKLFKKNNKSKKILKEKDSPETLVRFANLLDTIKNDFPKNSNSLMSDLAFQQLLDNFKLQQYKLQDEKSKAEFFNRYIPDHPIQIVVENESMAYYFLNYSEEGYLNPIRYFTLYKEGDKWKLFNIFHIQEFHHLIESNELVNTQFLSITTQH